MNDLYDKIQQQENRQPQKQDMLPKEEFAQQMKDRKNFMNQLTDSQLEKITTDPNTYLQYLNMQAKFDQYTVTNTILIQAQKPQASIIKDSSKWRESKCFVKKGEKGFFIFEPGKEYTRQDGSIGTSYNPKAMFDISQLARPPHTPNKPQLSTDELLGALLYNAPVKVNIVESGENVADVYYSSTDGQINVTNGLDAEHLLSGLARELCYAQTDSFDGTYQRDNVSFEAQSAAYMLCQKYGIPLQDKEFINDAPSYFKGVEPRESKEYMSGIKSLFSDHVERMEHGLYSQQQQKAKESHEVER